MAAKAEFKKGQKVVVYTGDFYTANVKATEYTVASCGAKQLHLIRNDGSNAEFRCYAPFRGERRYQDVQCASVDVAAHTLALRRQFAAWTREHFQRCLGYTGEGKDGYLEVVTKKYELFQAATADLGE